jgi:uncharacterized iron-regulated protein
MRSFRVALPCRLARSRRPAPTVPNGEPPWLWICAGVLNLIARAAMLCRWSLLLASSCTWGASVLALGLSGCAPAAAVPARAPTPAAPAPAAPAPRQATPLPADIVARSALPLHALVGAERLSEPELWQRMSAYRAVCLGEQHDSPPHHYAQRRAIEELARRSREMKRPLAVGFEMFQTPYQSPLSSFVAGSLPEAEFLTQSDYRERWGFDFALYRPLLEASREYGLGALALNAPRELTRKIGHAGLSSLDEAERKQLPELDLHNEDHRGYFMQAMAEHPMPAGGPKLDDMYAAQVVWDETMAETAARWLGEQGPQAQLIILAGSGHCHESAIPGRIARRLKSPVLSVSAVLESKLAEFDAKSRYDWLLVLEDVPQPKP